MKTGGGAGLRVISDRLIRYLYSPRGPLPFSHVYCRAHEHEHRSCRRVAKAD